MSGSATEQGSRREYTKGAAAGRRSAWTAGIAIGINLIVLGVGRVAGADMSVQPGSAAPMIIGVVPVVATV